MSPAAPEATNRARTTPRRDGVARRAGRGGEVATAPGRPPRRSIQTRRRLPDGGPTRQATVHSPPADGRVRNRSAARAVPTTRHRLWRVGMRLRRAGGGGGGGGRVAMGGGGVG